jgi:predicted site-specific integrase-resolvase
MNADNKITPQKAADILGVKRSRVRQFVASGELKTAGKFGSTTMFSESVVRELKKKRASRNGHKKRSK